MRILVADDHPVVRKGIKQILAGTSDMTVTGEATTREQLIEQVRAADWDAIILDMAMSGGAGLRVLKAVRRLRPKTPVLVLSAHPEERFAVRVLKAGAAGYLAKDSPATDLVHAIRLVAAGGRHISARLAHALASAVSPGGSRPPYETLSDREYEVMSLIASGKTIKEIAGELSLSVKTVSTYRSRVLEKIGVKTNAALTAYALRTRLVE